jgi:hypothetical protein
MSFDTGLVRLTLRPLVEIDSVAFVGESAAVVAESFAAAGGPPLVLEADHFAFATRSGSRPDAARLRDLAPGSVDLVVLRRAWRAVGEVGEALRTARAVLAPGGEMIAADLDVNLMLAGPSPRFPVRLLYLAEPTAANRMRASTATPASLGAEAVRAGFVSVEGFTYVDVRGSYPDVEALWVGIKARGWRGAAWVPIERQGEVFGVVADALAGAIPLGPAVDREPWYAVVGSKR